MLSNLQGISRMAFKSAKKIEQEDPPGTEIIKDKCPLQFLCAVIFFGGVLRGRAACDTPLCLLTKTAGTPILWYLSSTTKKKKHHRHFLLGAIVEEFLANGPIVQALDLSKQRYLTEPANIGGKSDEKC